MINSATEKYPTPAGAPMTLSEAFELRSKQPELYGVWGTETKRATPVHQKMLAELPGVKMLDLLATESTYGEPLVFEKDESGEIVSTLPFDFVGNELPPVPNDETPLLVITTHGGEDQDGVGSVCLVTRGNDKFKSVRKYYLEQPAFNADDDAVFPAWLSPGEALKTSQGHQLRVLVESPEVVTLAVSPDSGASNAERRISIYKADQTLNEEKLSAIEKTDTSARRMIRARKWLAGMILTSGLLSVTYDSEPARTAASSTYEQSMSGGDQAAIDRLKRNIELFERDEVDRLRSISIEEGFVTDVINQQSIDAVNEAATIKQVEDAAKNELERFGINLNIRFEDQSNVYEGVAKTDLEEARQTTLGIFDAMNDLGEIATEGRAFDFEIVGVIHDDEVDFSPDGVYSYNPYDNSKPILRIAAKSDRDRIKEVVIHEEAHHEDSTDNTIRAGFTSINGENFRYGSDGSGGGVVGHDIVSEYAGTDSGEDVAEMVEYLMANPKIDFKSDSPLQQKLLYVLASLESSHPGASAKLLSNAEQLSSNPTEGLERTVRSAQEHAKNVFIISILLELGVIAGISRTKDLKTKQRDAGTRR